MFFGGSIFVIVVCLLTLSTIKDIKRISKLEQENIQDPLMGIFNRRYLERRLNEEFSKSKRYHHSLSLFLLDVDFFKKVNDTYGHQAGDIVLKKLAQIIVESMRDTDLVARYGGEELVIVLPNTPVSGATIMAERCRNQVCEKLIVSSEESCGQSIDGITVSIGVSCEIDEIDDVNKLIECADKALYQAKEEGRNRVVVYDSTHA
jgi:diguanylate cyclase (GGDEF)-like protein